MKAAHIIIKDGLVFDGSLNPPSRKDIIIADDRVAEVTEEASAPAARVIDAKGLAVCPGFIDAHSHSDYTLLINPKAESKVRQGVTTEVIGNCGMSGAPLIGECQVRMQDYWSSYGLEVNWEGWSQYLRLLTDSGIALNAVPLVGHGNLRASVVGYADGEPSRAELNRMKDLLMDSMRAGVIGMSTGLIYPPGVFSGKDELLELCRVVAEHGGLYTSHIRNEGDGLEGAISEVIELCEETGLSLQISHLKASGQENWQRIDRAFELIEGAIGRGLDVCCDRYPYIASSTSLASLLPAWVRAGGSKEELSRLRDPAIRQRLKKEISEGRVGRDFWQRVMVSSVETEANRSLEGKNLADVAELRGVDPSDALLDLLVEEDLKVSGVFFFLKEENLHRVLEKPYTMVGSDSSARANYGSLGRGKPHPRGFGTFPRVLGKYVKEGVLSLEQAVYKMTLQPARKFRLQGRGRIAEGMYADLVIFDPDHIADTATYEYPKQYPVGIEKVLVNGTIVVEDGQHTGRLPGRVLLR